MLQLSPQQKARSFRSYSVPTVASQHQPITKKLAQHHIESTLQHGYPRLVEPRPLPYDWKLFAMWIAVQFAGNELTRWGGASWLSGAFWAVTVLNLGAGAVSLYRITRRIAERKQVPLLRNGIPVAAVIFDIYTSGRNSWIEFGYLDRFGIFQVCLQQVCVRRQEWSRFEIGSTFTLLVSPEDESQVLPYFLTREYDIVPVEATTVSERVSARIAVQATQIPTQPSTSLGLIEPELLGPTPRKVRSGAEFRRDLWTAGIIATAATAFVLNWHAVLTFLNYHRFACVMLPFVSAVLPRLLRTDTPAQINLLHSGIATRAKVSAIKPAPGDKDSSPECPLTITFAYKATDGKVHHQTCTMKRRRMWQLGIVTGATFTVLYHQDAPGLAKPYFMLRDAEVIGATGATVTPPSATP